MTWFDTGWSFLSSQMSQNNFLSGAVVGGVILSILASFKAAGFRCWMFLRDRLRMSLTIHSTDALYVPAAKWLLENKFDKFSRNYRANYSYGEKGICTLPTSGKYVFLYKGWPVFVYVERDQSPANAQAYGEVGTIKTKEYIHISYLGFSRGLLDTILKDMSKMANNALQKSTGLYCWAKTYWSRTAGIDKRFSKSLCLDDGLLEKVERDVQEFALAEEWYKERGLPYRRGYLLYGPPGTGKTSVARYLAAKYNRSIYTLGEMEYMAGIKDAVLSVPSNSILLLEDIDCYFNGRKGKSGGMNVGELFNALDGVVPLSDVIVVMTTNHIDQLDPALIRCGRTDVRLHLSYCTAGQMSRLFRKFYGKEVLSECSAARVLEGKSLTPAQIVEILKQNPVSPDLAIREIESCIE
jgi:chaperone BCS1